MFHLWALVYMIMDSVNKIIKVKDNPYNYGVVLLLYYTQLHKNSTVNFYSVKYETRIGM